jgi:hypothetical protein
MKHIGFDQSTVLKEFARIAHENGFVKVANTEEKNIKVAETPRAAALEKELQTYKALSAFYKSKMQNKKRSLLAKIVSEIQGQKAMMNIAKNLGHNKQITAADEIAYKTMARILRGIFKQMGASASWMNFIPPSLVTKQDVKIEEEHKRDVEGSTDLEHVKTADEKLYDVSGETGEDLIDTAHPGGGTKTELTHSKTDENLVETIVEQQEKDKEVATSVPKGTYATLVGLYNDLHKMGHKEKLGRLLNTIKAIATPEDIERHRLYVIANKLDQLGDTAAADKIDKLLKKKVASMQKVAILELLIPLAATIYHYSVKSSRALTELSRHISNLDPDEHTKALVQGWITNLKRHARAIYTAKPSSTDPKTIAARNAQMLKAQRAALQYVKSIQRDFATHKAGFSDWAGSWGDIGDAEKAITTAISELTTSVAKSQESVNKANTQAKRKQEEKGVAGKGDKKGDEIKWTEKDQEGFDDIGSQVDRELRKEKILKWQKAYNNIMGLEKGDKGFLKEDGIRGFYTKKAMQSVTKSGAKTLAEYKKKIDEAPGMAGEGKDKKETTIDTAKVGPDTTREDYNKRINAVARQLVRGIWNELGDLIDVSSARTDISMQQLRNLRQRTLPTYAIRMLREMVPFAIGSKFTLIEDPGNMKDLMEMFRDVIRKSNLAQIYKRK